MFSPTKHTVCYKVPVFWCSKFDESAWYHRARAQEAAGDLYLGPMRKLCPSASVLFTRTLRVTSRLLLFPCRSFPSTPGAQCVGAPTGLIGLTRQKSTGTSGGFCSEATAVFISLVVGGSENVFGACFFLTGSWSSAWTDWSLCGWYRWAVITAQWEWPWITSFRLNWVSTQYSNRSSTAAICLVKELRPLGRRLQLWLSFIFHLPSAFPQVTVALISFLETMLITYLSYKVGKWSARPHFFSLFCFLHSIHCTFSFLFFFSWVFLTVVIDSITYNDNKKKKCIF